MNAKVIIPIIFSAMLLSGNATAKPPKEPKIDDVNVVNTPDVNVVTAIEWRFAGFTSFITTTAIEYDGLVGHAAMNAACFDEVSQNSRVCNSSEIGRSIMPIDGEGGWVIPTKREMTCSTTHCYVFDPYTTESWAQDTSQSPLFDLLNGLGCGGFESEEGAALIALRSKVTLSFCGNEVTKPIACCAPVAVPVQ